MGKLVWDNTGERLYETGVDHGVLYRIDAQGAYSSGYVWNGLVSVTESPSGAESNPQYADNLKYLNLVSAEEFGATIEAYTYPDEFGECDGTASPQPGIVLGQQGRKSFGFSYRTKIGNDVAGQDFGYRIHLVYGCLAAPSEKAYNTVNDSPEAITFSWELSTSAVMVDGFKPVASMSIDSTKVAAAKMAALEEILYGTAGTDPRLPLPGEVIALVSGVLVEAAPVAPSYNAATKTITVPVVAGVEYRIGNDIVSGDIVITEDTVVTARPSTGYKFPTVTDDDWLFEF